MSLFSEPSMLAALPGLTLGQLDCKGFVRAATFHKFGFLRLGPVLSQAVKYLTGRKPAAIFLKRYSVL